MNQTFSSRSLQGSTRELIEKEKGGLYIIISFIEKSATKKEKRALIGCLKTDGL